MSRVHHFFNQFRLGDCLWTCHWLRKMALAYPEEKFLFYCNTAHHWQTSPLLEGCPNAELRDLSEAPHGAINTWINAHGEYPPKDRDQVMFFTHVFNRVAQAAGLESPLQKREDWLFDYPALDEPANPNNMADWMMVDSRPQSGQFNFSTEEMFALHMRLDKKRYFICKTSMFTKGEVSVTEWGRISKLAKNILMIATGPCWPTFNAVTESRLKNRIILQGEGMILNYGREWPHFTNLPDAVKYMEAQGLI